MKKTTQKRRAARVGLLFGAVAFVALSLLVGGLVEVSHEVGFARWLADFAVYTLSNKLIYKLVASVAIGGFAAFASNMIAYGKAIKEHKVHRVRFQAKEETDSSTRIA